MFVDYAGAGIPIHNRATGEIHQAAIFVAALGVSSYTFAEATWSQELPCWIGSHIRALEYFGGLPMLVVPDNLKTGVTKACRYEPDLNPTYSEMAAHYGVAVLPARPRKPRDKAKAENAVQVVQRWIVAALRKHTFFSLGEVNQAIGELLVRLNQKPFRKREGTRASLFAALDQPALRPLPAERYEIGQWRKLKVELDYHVPAEGHFYSVPYQLAGQQVDIRVTAATVEIFHRGLRVASHARSFVADHATTHCRASAQGASTVSGVDAIAFIELGRRRRAEHCGTVPPDPGRQAASGNGISLLSRPGASNRQIYQGASGSGRWPSFALPRLLAP